MMSLNGDPDYEEREQLVVVDTQSSQIIERKKTARCLRRVTCTRERARPTCYFLLFFSIGCCILSVVMSAFTLYYAFPYFSSNHTTAVVDDYLTYLYECNGLNWTGFVMIYYCAGGEGHYHYDMNNPYCGANYTDLTKQLDHEWPLGTRFTIYYPKSDPTKILSSWLPFYFNLFELSLSLITFFLILALIHPLGVMFMGFATFGRNEEVYYRIHDPFDHERDNL